MNPHQKNKVDISSLSAEEQRLFRLYGKLPNRKDLLQNKLKERKYFDSGDYALSKAGKADDVGVTQIGREHPVPENIPHSSSPHNGAGAGGNANTPTPHNGGQSSSPVKENTFLHRETSLNRETTLDEQDAEGKMDSIEAQAEAEGKGVPIRQS